jgi:hypothetical protein
VIDDLNVDDLPNNARERGNDWWGDHSGMTMGASLVALVIAALVIVEVVGALVGHFTGSVETANDILCLLYARLLLVGLVATALVSIVFAVTTNPIIGGLFDSFGARSRFQEFNFGMSLGLVGVTLGTVLAFAQFCGHVSDIVGGFSLTHDDFWQWSFYGLYLLGDAFTFGAIQTFLVPSPITPTASWAKTLDFLLFVFLQLSAFSVLISVTSPLIRRVTDAGVTFARELIVEYAREVDADTEAPRDGPTEARE